MATVSRFLPLSACCAGFLALSLASPLHARDILPGSDVRDLVCPDVKPAAIKPVPKHPTDQVSMAGNRMPDDSELGPLAMTVIRRQPLLPAKAIVGLSPGSAGQPRHVAFWGDSHLAGGPFASTLIQALREKGLNVSSRFLPPTMGRANVRLPGLRAYCIGTGWTTDIAYTSPMSVDIGPALANRVAEASPHSYLWLDFRNEARQTDVQRVQLIYKAPVGASVRYVVDDGTPHMSSLPATSTSQILSVSSRGSISTLKLNISKGKLILLGFVLDHSSEPDMTIDVFGLPSATVKGWANANPQSLVQSLHGVDYDGVVLEYGTNEGADPDFEPAKYSALLSKALGNLRQVFPKASCVLVGPPDRGVLRQGKESSLPLLTYGNIHGHIEQIQREVGSRYGCVTWNWQALMGGSGGSYGWAHAHPSLMGRDLIHLSPDGYRLTARSLAYSLGWTP